MIANNEHIDILLGKVLTDEASERELQEFYDWLADDESHAEYFRQTKSVYDGSAADFTVSEFDTDKAWNRIGGRIQSEPRVIRLKTSPWKVWEIAAVVVVLLGLAGMVYFFRGNESQEFAINSGNTIVTDTLPDGSRVKLNANSDLTFAQDQNKHERRATLKGEAFFHVVHQEEETFVVDVGDDVWVKDIGTAFNVTAEPGSDSVRVFVREGVVLFASDENKGMTLHAGEEGLYIRSTKQFQMVSEPSEQVEPSWADHEFNFRNAPLRRVIKKINKYYGDQIELDRETLGDCRISVHFMNDDAATIADVIAETMGWKVVHRGDKLVLEGEMCQ